MRPPSPHAASPLGVLPCYVHTRTGAQAARVRDLLRRDGPPPGWCLAGVRHYLQRQPDGVHTCFAEVELLPPLPRPTPSGEALQAALERAVAEIAQDQRRAAVALSGGLDSALVVALLHACGRADIPVFTLATHLPGYCELETTRQAASSLGLRGLEVIEASGAEMIAAFPAAITAAECPLFNLHPVSRWLLATRLRAAGYEVLITGDGADQVFAGSDPRNYLPIIGALTRAAGLELCSPFLHPAVLAAAPPPTPGKEALRAVASSHLAAVLSSRPKQATYAPPLDVSAHWQAGAIDSLADQLGVSAPPTPGAGAESVLWTALGILAGFFDASLD